MTCEANGMCDFMENIAGADTFEMDRDKVMEIHMKVMEIHMKVMEIHMFQDDGDDIDIIEIPQTKRTWRRTNFNTGWCQSITEKAILITHELNLVPLSSRILNNRISKQKPQNV
jgi:hypothetical protein